MPEITMTITITLDKVEAMTLREFLATPNRAQWEIEGRDMEDFDTLTEIYTRLSDELYNDGQ